VISLPLQSVLDSAPERAIPRFNQAQGAEAVQQADQARSTIQARGPQYNRPRCAPPRSHHAAQKENVSARFGSTKEDADDYEAARMAAIQICKFRTPQAVQFERECSFPLSPRCRFLLKRRRSKRASAPAALSRTQGGAKLKFLSETENPSAVRQGLQSGTAATWKLSKMPSNSTTLVPVRRLSTAFNLSAMVTVTCSACLLLVKNVDRPLVWVVLLVGSFQSKVQNPS
jgi:hypothetical protein